MINATMRTNLDPKNIGQKQSFLVLFPAVPSVGQSFMWGDQRTHICSVGWSVMRSDTTSDLDEMKLIVEFNK